MMKNDLNECTETRTFWRSNWKNNRNIRRIGGLVLLCVAILLTVFLAISTSQKEKEQEIHVGSFTLQPKYLSGYPVKDLFTEPEMVEEYAEFIYRNTRWGRAHPEHKLVTISLDDEAGIWWCSFSGGSLSLGGGYEMFISRDNGAVLDESGYPVKDLFTDPKMVKEYAKFIYRNTRWGKAHPENKYVTISLDDEAGIWWCSFFDDGLSLGGGYEMFISRDNGAVLDKCNTE